MTFLTVSMIVFIISLSKNTIIKRYSKQLRFKSFLATASGLKFFSKNVYVILGTINSNCNYNNRIHFGFAQNN